MPKLIFISGSINAGKSTISKALSQSFVKTAHVKGDDLRHCVTWLPLEQAIPIARKAIVAVAKTFLAEGFNVVIDYPLTKDEYQMMITEMQDFAEKSYAFILSPRLEVAQSQRDERALSQWEVNRIAHHYEINLNKPGYGVEIDNSELSIEETVNKILEHLKS